ncbi:hypothetical protein [Gluconacetobacter entanii]|uniref:Uncharacterized protein n=1 Tax=Gluconacetobacter entanii TaxID=108528 RepID=A0A318PTP7_9PROT|nr:hypothetical protein [Gluconacetobacter entanii]PYD63971.1 hypothetical protein CFR72_04615 [Gluconacetobacter entanii]
MADAKKTDGIEVVTLIPVYPEAGKAPYPIGTRLKVALETAAFWKGRGIARFANDPRENAATVSAGITDRVKNAPLPPAPVMTPPPASMQQGFTPPAA